MKREINNKKKQEVEKYLQMLKLEDQKYDYESTNLAKLENELIRMYKKWGNQQRNFPKND